MYVPFFLPGMDIAWCSRWNKARFTLAQTEERLVCSGQRIITGWVWSFRTGLIQGLLCCPQSLAPPRCPFPSVFLCAPKSVHTGGSSRLYILHTQETLVFLWPIISNRNIETHCDWTDRDHQTAECSLLVGLGLGIVSHFQSWNGHRYW